MDFKQLEAFQAVLDKGSYSEAAKHLYVSQPTISVRLKALQEELGVVLFRQNGRKVRATLAGRILAHYAADMLKLQKDALQAIHDTKDMKRTTIRISTTSTGTYILPRIAKGFQEAFPGTRLSLSISNAVRGAVQTTPFLSEQLYGDCPAGGHSVGRLESGRPCSHVRFYFAARAWLCRSPHRACGRLPHSSAFSSDHAP